MSGETMAGDPELPRWALRVLVVEDEALLRSLARRLVARIGHEADVAAGAGEAAALARSARYDAVICDFQLSGETAAGVLIALQAVDSELVSRFIVTSGDTTDAEFSRLVRDSGVTVLAKPYGLQDLAAALSAVSPRGD